MMRRFFGPLVLLFGFTVTATAQEFPRVEASGGYSLLNDRNTDRNLHGWVASVTGNIGPVFGITSEIGGHYDKRQRFGRPQSYPFLVGPRFASRSNQRVTPYAHVLLGPFVIAGTGPTDVEFALQPGAGIDFWFGRRVGVRTGGDFRRVFADDEHADQVCFQLGVVVRTGAR